MPPSRCTATDCLVNAAVSAWCLEKGLTVTAGLRGVTADDRKNLCGFLTEMAKPLLISCNKVSSWVILPAIQCEIHYHCGSRYKDRSSADIHIDIFGVCVFGGGGGGRY